MFDFIKILIFWYKKITAQNKITKNVISAFTFKFNWILICQVTPEFHQFKHPLNEWIEECGSCIHASDRVKVKIEKLKKNLARSTDHTDSTIRSVQCRLLPHPCEVRWSGEKAKATFVFLRNKGKSKGGFRRIIARRWGPNLRNIFRSLNFQAIQFFFKEINQHFHN